jgi:hypothetical protein
VGLYFCPNSLVTSGPLVSAGLGLLRISDHRGPMMIDTVLGWFPQARREWIELIVVVLLLLLLMMAAVSDPELVTVG